MINKLLKISSTIVAFVLLFALSFSAALAAESFALNPLKPQLSRDGKKMYHGIPAVVYRLDPNPSPQRMRIPPPSFLRAPIEKASAAFAITYVATGGEVFGYPCTTFPEAAKTAFNAAAAVWAGLLTSPVPITINACWSNDLPAGVLGASGGGTIYRDESGLPAANTWYGASLANALHGSDLDPSDFDMNIIYNSTMDWYYGTDGNPGASQIDLESVVLHEIAHGLNFSGSMTVSSGSGSWGYGTGYPNIYDTFMYDAETAGNQLIATGVYANPSILLGTALTSDSVWFGGPLAVTANGGRVKMWTPTTWYPGSSYSHLDYDTFHGTANTLMVYAISDGESIHDPGPVALAMFKDMGWPDKSATTADVGVTITDSPDPLVIGTGNITYTITVTNNDLVNTAAGVIMTDNLPASVNFVSATPGAGSCTGTGTIACSLGSIAATTSVSIIVVVTPTSAAATLNNTVSISSTSTDGTSGNDSATASTTLSNPVPVISSLSPASATAGSAAFTLTVNGSNFSADSVVQWGGANRTTTFISFTQLTAAISAADIATAGTVAVTVVTTPAGGTSASSDFTINAPYVPPPPSSGNMCFIATAAFGSPLEKHVQILRDFRDSYLLNFSAGKAFVKFYYEVSPPIAKIIAQSQTLRLLTRASLMPVIGVAYLILNFGPLSALLMLLAMLAALSAIIRMTRRKLNTARQKAEAFL